MSRFFLILFVCFCSLTTQSQSIRFVETDLDNAISKAQRQNKPLFVDTYASYCVPCKKMEIEFRNPELANYFNENFVNIKIDMESDRAKQYQNEYQIVFLPTLLFLTQNGAEQLKISNSIKAKDLLNIAMQIVGHKTIASHQSSVTPSPSSSVTKSSTKNHRPQETTIDDPTILHVHDSDLSDMPPDLLREEAYLHMQFMDGSHHKVAAQYLATQSDWGSDQNMRFIHDFIYKVRSREFEFLLENRSRFNNLIGKTNIDQTVSILVNRELERGFPRPDYDRATLLYSYIDPLRSTQLAKEYLLDNKYYEGDQTTFVNTAKEYVEKEYENTYNHQLLHRYASHSYIIDSSKRNLKKCTAILNKAISIYPSSALYHTSLAEVYHLRHDKSASLTSLAKAQSLLTGDDNQNLIDKIDVLSRKINL